MPLDIRPDHRKIVEEILEKHVPDREVWAFGSRVNGTAKGTSDLDLVVIGETPLDFQTLGDLRDAFSESDIPYKVDVVDWATISETFREIIRKDKVEIQKGSKNDWGEATFSELCNITRGASPRPINDWTTKNGIPWVKISDASSSMSRFIEITNEHIKKEAQSRSVKVFPGDLILSNSATPGIPMFMKIEACIHDGWLLLRNFRGIDKVFAYYLLVHERSALVQQGNGSVFTNLKTEILKKHKILLPPLPEQRAIAHILGTLDDKIELNRRMNETLETMARAIFKSWFVDFDPVRAKAEGRDTGLPKEIADLFPDGFEDSELGEIPRGWKVEPFTNVVEIIGGGTPKTSVAQYWNGSIFWFSVEDSPNDSDIWVVDTKRRITEEGFLNSSTKILPFGSVIITARGTVGKLALVGFPMAMNQSCYGVRGKIEADYWVYFMIKDLITGLKQRTHGSVFDTITRNTLEKVSLVLPPNKILVAFQNQVQSMLDKIRLNLNESRTLANIRDTFLPKLLSGEIRLTELKEE